ncbi:hypothetical protein QSU92_05055 [Microbacterium sp. ET2]|uniref:hypothetical protein n=1 Tax=Microbacterium albipurpureum TaxID=3050384 RepID=UPI00259D2E55|nr:hypothetical protein [Microbacterium sp. ET2 (Ac-2212)]WJL96551.1 hypothetical protein QSU92_05055 [Microbacterium sp. ET2 (Ac-2212)]
MATSGSVGALVPAGPAAAGWGAGLLLIALGAGALTGEATDLGGRVLGLALATIGFAALVWGGISLARGRLIMTRAVGVTVLVTLVALVAAFIHDPAGNSILAVAVTALLLTVVAGWTAVARRRDADARPDAGSLGIIVAAMLVAGIVTPALAASEAARVSADSGGRVTVLDRDGHDH